jgi:MFS transporter, PAT family, beta-lactamase induction signal transducer AmpG
MTVKISRLQFVADLLSDRRLLLMLALGYSSGLPIRLVFSTQSAWLREAGLPLTEIGLMSWVALAYSLKFLWAPIIDAREVPLLGRLLGRRRAWMLVSQLAVVLGLTAVAFGDPAHALAWTVVSAFFLGFASATQDIVIDGFRIASAPVERQGVMSAAAQLGYSIALLCAGAGALYIADFVSWKAAYLTMAILMSVGIVANLLAKEPVTTTGEGSAAKRGRISLSTSFVEPLADLLRRKGWTLLPLVLALVALYRLPDFISGVMANPLYVDLGFSNSDIATVTKLYGFWVGIVGVSVGGIGVARLGLMPTLLIGGVAASLSHLSMALLAANGPRFDLFTLAVSMENFASAIAGTALIAYMSSLTSPVFAATQYALLSSLYALPGKVVGGLSGWMVKALGYPTFFATTSLIGIPVVILCLLVWRIETVRQAAVAHGEAGGAEPEPIASLGR